VYRNKSTAIEDETRNLAAAKFYSSATYRRKAITTATWKQGRNQNFAKGGKLENGKFM